jgi:hypothetical protein
MRIIEAAGRATLDFDRMVSLLRRSVGAGHVRGIVLACAGACDPATLEPLATLDRVLGPALDDELRVVACDGFAHVDPGPAAGWSAAVDPARIARQAVDDGRLEILFMEHGVVVGAALTLVARRGPEGRPLPLNVKFAVMELLQAARDAMPGREMSRLVQDAREALGIPAGSVTSISQVRRQRGEAPAQGVVSVDRVAEALRAASTTPPRPTTSPTVSPPSLAAPARRAAPQDRHALEAGRCVQCGRTGAALEGPCGRADLGRVGLLELE